MVGPSSSSRRRDPWAIVRSVVVIAGLGFVVASLAVACLDHYDEGYGCPIGADGGPDCDASTTTTTDAAVGSGSGSGAI